MQSSSVGSTEVHNTNVAPQHVEKTLNFLFMLVHANETNDFRKQFARCSACFQGLMCTEGNGVACVPHASNLWTVQKQWECGIAVFSFCIFPLCHVVLLGSVVALVNCCSWDLQKGSGRNLSYTHYITKDNQCMGHSLLHVSEQLW